MAGGRERPSGHRFFSEASPWRLPVPEGAPVHPDSERMVRASFRQDPGIYVNMNCWSIPVHFVDFRTPTRDVRCVYGKSHGDRPTFRDPSGKGWIIHTDYGVLLRDVPIPEDALPDAAIALRPEVNADAHLCLVDLERGLEWDFCWMAKKPDGEWFAGQGVVFRTDGDGILANYEGSARGSGFPLTAGLIFRDEMAAGVIEHPLVIALKPPGRGHVWPPASCCDGPRPVGSPEWGIPEGALIQLDPELDVDSLGLDRAATIVARAMQRYGMYVCDGSGSVNLYAEAFPFAEPDPWRGLLSIDSPNPIPVDRLQVIDWGGRYFEEREKPSNQVIFKDPHFFPPLPDADAARVLRMLNYHRGRYKLPLRTV